MKTNGAIKRKGAEGYFAAANTRYGFYSLYDEIYSERELKRVYIIKGGPGTGKSTMMDRIAERASREGMHTDVYLCSSAPESVDGVIIKESGIAILDGTAPHTRDPMYPGICGEIVDIGRFWDVSRLAESKREITNLIAQKSEAYKRAYRYLAAAGEADEDVNRGISAIFDRSKAERAVSRLLDKYKSAGQMKDSTVKRRFVGAISTSGAGQLDTFEKKAEAVYGVGEMYGTGGLLLDIFKEEGRRRGLTMTLIPDPLSPERTDGIFFDSCGLYVTSLPIGRTDAHVINMKRFVHKEALSEIRGKIRISVKMRSLLLDEALCSLSDAGAAHAETETLYGAAMDFDGVKAFTDEIINRIFG